MRLRWGTLGLLVLLMVMASPQARSRAELALRILFNGQPSSTQVVTTDRGSFVPVYFPVPEGSQEWQVQLKLDAEKHIVSVERKEIQFRRIRGDKPCWHCSGSGDCQSCYPVGSGKNVSGQACYACNGTGDCWYCNGTGTSWK